jgi:hypothetical protein
MHGSQCDLMVNLHTVTLQLCYHWLQGVTAFKDRIATVDDPLVQWLEEQGAIIVGEPGTLLACLNPTRLYLPTYKCKLLCVYGGRGGDVSLNYS